MDRRFGRALREARTALRLSRPKLGARAGFSERSIARWELEGAYPHPQQRVALVRALGAAGLASAQLAEIAALLELPVPAAPAPAPRALDWGDFVRRAAEDFDVPPSRARDALPKLLRRLRDARLSIDAALTAAEAATRARA